MPGDSENPRFIGDSIALTARQTTSRDVRSWSSGSKLQVVRRSSDRDDRSLGPAKEYIQDALALSRTAPLRAPFASVHSIFKESGKFEY